MRFYTHGSDEAVSILRDLATCEIQQIARRMYREIMVSKRQLKLYIAFLANLRKSTRILTRIGRYSCLP